MSLLVSIIILGIIRAKSIDAGKYSWKYILFGSLAVYVIPVGYLIYQALVPPQDGLKISDVPLWWWGLIVAGPFILLNMVRLFPLNKNKQIPGKTEHNAVDNVSILSATKTKDILVIGGPPKDAQWYSTKGIKQIDCDPISVLKHDRPLYDYDIVIFWPTARSINDFELTITKDELFKAIPHDYFNRYHHYAIKQRVEKFFRWFDSFMLPLSGAMIINFVTRRFLHKAIKLSKGQFNQKELAALFDKNEWIICGGPEHDQYDNILTNLDNMFQDKQEKVDANDKRNVYAWYQEKLCEILLGIAHRQLAFIIFPKNKYYNHPDIFSWIPFNISFDYEHENIVPINKSSEANRHPIQTIMEGLESIVSDWTSRLAIIPASGHPNRLFILGSKKTLRMKVTGYKSEAFQGYPDNFEREDDFPNDASPILDMRVGHTDKNDDPCSLMMLTEKGGLAVIPEPQSIDDFVGLITKSLSPPALNEIPYENVIYSIEECRRCKDDIEARLKIMGKKNPLVGDSPAILQLYPELLRAAKYPLHTILIYGEVGSGKEVLSELISMLGKDPNKVIRLNVAADSVNTQLAPSNLFGHEQGAFTDAKEEHDGAILEAGNGTLILDGMERTSRDYQKLFLRALDPEKREYYKLGSHKVQKAYCRFVLCFNIPIKDMLKAGMLIPDIIERCPIHIQIPSLRDRKEDILLLVKHFVQRFCENQPMAIIASDIYPPPEIIAKWQAMSWGGADGNVRGLKNDVNKFLERQLDAMERQKKENMSHRGRKPGRDIDDQTLVDILKRCADNKQTLDDVFHAINLSMKPGKEFGSTLGNLRQRISRIESDQLKDEANKYLNNIIGYHKRPSKSSAP